MNKKNNGRDNNIVKKQNDKRFKFIRRNMKKTLGNMKWNKK